MSRGSLAPFPGPGGSVADADENEWWLRREISLIKNLLDEEGELDRKEIGDQLGCKYWGPMRFRHALSAMLAIAIQRNQLHRPRAIQRIGRNQILQPIRLHLHQQILHPTGFKLKNPLRLPPAKHRQHVLI